MDPSAARAVRLGMRCGTAPRGRAPAVDPAVAAATLDVRVGTVTRTDTAVSLTGQLTGGDLGRWCAATLTGTARLADDVAAAATNLRPIRPSRVDDPRDGAAVGRHRPGPAAPAGRPADRPHQPATPTG